MSTLRTLKKLILGETWILPIGLAMTLAAGTLVHPSGWSRLGGFALLAAVLVVLIASVSRSARRR
jgi:membrane protein implicated in regulation of membrane protease activity